MASRNTWTTRTDGGWHLVVVGVVDWFYWIVINADVKPSQSAGTGDRARGTGRGVLGAVLGWGTVVAVVAVAAVLSMNCLSGLVVL